MFASAGMMWAAFTILSRRWHINPLAATAVVSVPSAFVYVPGYLLMVDTGRLLAAPLHELLSQIIVSGCAFGRASRACVLALGSASGRVACVSFSCVGAGFSGPTRDPDRR
jgi:hypothetical protein